MGLETGTYISDLVTTNPTAGDPVSQADDHFRLVKSVLQNQFPDASSGAIYGLRAKTTQATTAGTTTDFTSIPSWVKRVTIMFSGVSTTGGSNMLVQIGDSGGIETSGYLGASAAVADSATPGVATFTTGFGINASGAANVLHGNIVLTLLDAATFTWSATGTIANSNVAAIVSVAGSKSLSATLDRVRVTTVSGTPTFDAGSINVLYE